MVTSTSAPASAETLDLRGRKGLVVGIANEHSLAWSSAQHFRNAGAELALTYLNEKAKPFVEPLANELAAPIFLPCDVLSPGQLEAVSSPLGPNGAVLTSFFTPSLGHARRTYTGD